MRVITAIMIMLVLGACNRQAPNYQATIVSQQSTMIVMMRSATPSQTPTPTKTSISFGQVVRPQLFNNRINEQALLNAVQTLVALESQEANTRNTQTQNDTNNNIARALNQNVRQQATVIAQNERLITALDGLRTQPTSRLNQSQPLTLSNYNATMVAINETALTINARILRLQATAARVDTSASDADSQLIRLQSEANDMQRDAVSLATTSVVLAQKQNTYLQDHTYLLTQICLNTAPDRIAERNCRR